eukprot:GHVU01037968.1.p1 GENE.GHVU01037968.1~~GHVU01037968.1.p1  ORF type:complete len:335 (+),score=18.54 GHVU01037968.1:127-1005(+)
MKTFTVRCKRIFQLMMRPLYTSLGTHLLALALELNDNNIRDATLAKALYWLERGRRFDRMSGELKLALFYCMIGDYSQVIKLVRTALDSAGSQIIECNGTTLEYFHEEHLLPTLQEFLNRLLKDNLNICYAFEVTCMKTEMSAVPHPFKYEIALVYAKLDGYPTHLETPGKESKWASIESKIFAYVFLILGYYNTGQRSRMLEALAMFEKYFREKQQENRLYHPCHALNLLAQCYCICGDVHSAVRTLGESLAIQPSCTCNAAPWMLAVILFALYLHMRLGFQGRMLCIQMI